MDTSNSTNPHKDELAAISIRFVKSSLTTFRNHYFMGNELLLWQETSRFCEERIQSILRKTQVTEDNSTPAMRGPANMYKVTQAVKFCTLRVERKKSESAFTTVKRWKERRL
jgi:hypothetical protein